MLFKNTFKLPKNDRFHYTPRYFKGSEEGENTLRSFQQREDINLNYNDIKGQWHRDRMESRNRSNYQLSRRLIIIIGLLVLFVLYLFEFDLSIFQ